MTDPARDAVLALLAARTPGATVCPSEVARTLAAAGWRDAMPVVHAAVDRLLTDGWIALSWRKKPLAHREGPCRIARAAGPDKPPT